MSRKGVEVRHDMTAAVLRKKARQEKDVLAASRMLGIANILDGMDRTAAAKAAGMDRQTLCDWVHRYNQKGLIGLYNYPKGRPPRALTSVQEKEVETLVLKEPDGSRVRWRCIDVQQEIEKRYGIVLHERSVEKLLKRLGFRRMSARSLHPENDPAASEAFKKTSPPAWRTSSLRTPKAKALSSGSKTRRVWVKKEL